MNNKNNSLSATKFLGKLIKPKKVAMTKKDRLEGHQPSWMYRNE